MSYKNILCRFVHRLVAPPPLPSSSSTPQRILAVSTTALGDTLWTMPALSNLRSCFPDAYLAFLTSSLGFEVAQNNPWTDAVYRFHRPHQLWYHLKGQFDTILLFHASQRIVPLFLSSLGASRLVATAGLNKGLDDLFTHTLPPSYQHEIDRRLSLIKLIGGFPSPSPLSFFLKTEEKISLPNASIALHPGAKDSYKCWPLEHFASVGRSLQSLFACHILITGSPHETPLMQKLSSLIPNSSISPTTSLRNFAATLAAVKLLISSDTGPFHLACALKTPAIGIYSPTDPALCGPYLCPTAVLCAKPRSCTPCLRRQCKTPFCLLQIGPEEVVEKAEKLLREAGLRPAPHQRTDVLWNPV